MQQADDINDIVDTIAEWIDVTARSGMVSRADLLQQVRDRIDDDLGDSVDALTVEVLETRAKNAVARREEDERTWPGVTMNDRIDKAFAELNTSGIIALQGAGFTKSEGWDEANDIAAEMNPSPRGAVFFHWQDIERAVEGKGLWLVFGAYSDEEVQDDESIAIAREVVEVLKKHGVPSTWDGTAEQRVLIDPFPWQRRYRSEEP